MLKHITPVILTFDEEANIGRTLQGLTWARDIVVVDSFSADSTVQVVSGFSNTRVFQRRFDSHAQQWNFAIGETGVATDWVLALDADYGVKKEFISELSRLEPEEDCSGYAADFVYCVMGHPLRAALYPPVTVLFRRENARFVQTGHTQRIETPGPIRRLKTKLLHDDRKSLSRWFSSQMKYARLEAEHLLESPKEKLRSVDQVRLMAWPAPFLVLFFTLLVKGCVADGWPGWFYVLQRTLAEIMIALELVERRIRLKLS